LKLKKTTICLCGPLEEVFSREKKADIIPSRLVKKKGRSPLREPAFDGKFVMTIKGGGGGADRCLFAEVRRCFCGKGDQFSDMDMRRGKNTSHLFRGVRTSPRSVNRK